MAFVEYLKRKAAEYTCQVHMLYIALRDPRTPRRAKILTALVVAYALSPIDLVPDFIPVLGYLDDLVLLPLGIMAAIRMIPPEVLTDSRRKAAGQATRRLPRSMAGGSMIVSIWLVLMAIVGIIFIRIVF